MLRRILLSSAGAMALAGAAFAAEPIPAPPPPPPPPIWTGFYAGLNVGWAWSSSNDVRTITAPIFIRGGNAPDPDPEDLTIAALSQTGRASVPSDGIIGGGQFGYNYQFGLNLNWLVGIEADIQGLGQRGHGTFTGLDFEPPAEDVANSVVRSERDVDWLGTVRGRLGWLISPTFLVFGDGGFAYGGVRGVTNVHAFWRPGTCDAAGCDTWSDSFGSFNNTRAGWTAGGGVEWLFMPNWSLKVEYLYYDLGRITRNLSPNFAIDNNGAPGAVNLITLPTSSFRFNGNIVRVGLNYHFTWPAPVVAKY